MVYAARIEKKAAADAKQIIVFIVTTGKMPEKQMKSTECEAAGNAIICVETEDIYGFI